MSECTCGSQRTAFGSQFFPLCGPEIKLSSLGWIVSALPVQPSLLAATVPLKANKFQNSLSPAFVLSPK